MLWIVRFEGSDSPGLGNDKNREELAQIHYPTMLSIAKTIYSPVGFLDIDTRAVLALDKDSMMLIGEGTSFYVDLPMLTTSWNL